MSVDHAKWYLGATAPLISSVDNYWPPKLAAALVAAVERARAVYKEGKNEHHKFRYAMAEDIINEGRIAMAGCGLTLAQLGTVMLFREDSGVQVPVYRCTYALVHESGESVQFCRDWPVVEGRGRPLDRTGGGALTSGLAYAFRDLLSLPRSDELADMDRRDDREHEPREAKRDERAEVTRAEESKAMHAPNEQPQKSEQLPPYDSIMRLFAQGGIGRGMSDLIDGADQALSDNERSSLRFVLRAYEARDTSEFAKVGADIRRSDMPEEWRKRTLDSIRPAWDALQMAKTAA